MLSALSLSSRRVALSSASSSASASSLLSSFLLSSSLRRLQSTSAYADELPSTLLVHIDADTHVATVTLNRPRRGNSLDATTWAAIGRAFTLLADDAAVRAVVLRGAGRHFCGGIALDELAALAQLERDVPERARRSLRLRAVIDAHQRAFSQLERCAKPVVAALAGACVGGGVDLAAAADVRVCAASTVFSIREAAVGLAADVGSLQRLPRACGNHSLLRQLAFTGEDFDASTAERLGLVSEIVAPVAGADADADAANEAVVARATAIAQRIAANSPVAVQATKMTLLNTANSGASLDEQLEYVRNLNMTFLDGDDLRRVAAAMASKQRPVFDDV